MKLLSPNLAYNRQTNQCETMIFDVECENFDPTAETNIVTPVGTLVEEKAEPLTVPTFLLTEEVDKKFIKNVQGRILNDIEEKLAKSIRKSIVIKDIKERVEKEVDEKLYS